MRKLLPAGLLLVAVTLALLPRAHSEMSEEEKRALFLHSCEDIRPVPRASPTPRPRPTPAATPRPHPKPTPRATPEEPPEEDREKPIQKPRPTPDEKEKPRDVESEPTPRASPRAMPTPKPMPTPKLTPAPKSADHSAAPIVIEKSGLAEDEGDAPPPPKKRWSLFGGGEHFTYLTPSVRAAIDNAKVKKGRWKYIVVHNSGTRQGNARAFDIYHRTVRHMPNGLAYHFVIGNGHSSGDGEIEIGGRWKRQINGGHVASDYLNNIALGICLVGDFNRDVPTKAQQAALTELINYLRRRCGKVKGHDIIVRGHKQINPKPTDCPGDRFPLKWLNRTFHD